MKILFRGSKPETKVVGLSMRMMDLPNHLKEWAFYSAAKMLFYRDRESAFFGRVFYYLSHNSSPSHLLFLYIMSVVELNIAFPAPPTIIEEGP